MLSDARYRIVVPDDIIDMPSCGCLEGPTVLREHAGPVSGLENIKPAFKAGMQACEGVGD